MPLTNGSRIGPYEIVGWLGAGGMGEVYRARDSRLARDVAIKLIPETLATDKSRLQRFEQEARAAGQLNHPNILAVYDVGTHASAPYIVSELLEGEALRSRLAGSALPPRKAIDYARQIAEGLAAAHDKGIVHRDVKPENLFITREERVKILDFGIAKLIAPSDEAARHTGVPTETAEGMVVGTAGYMSPEQVRGESVDARSDIFNFGMILYEMLTGRPAFARDTAAETMAAILKEDPPEPLPTNLSPALARIVSRCLEKTREARFQSARDLAFGLEYLTGTTPTMAPAAVVSPPRWRTALGLAVVVLSLVTAVASWLTRSTEPTPLENPLANARFTAFTDWEGTEGSPEISPDGRFVAFIADRDGEFDLFLSQVGTGDFRNLTASTPPLSVPHPLLRTVGFSGDGAEIWFSLAGDPIFQRKMLMPLFGGMTRPFLAEGATSPAWSSDGTRLVYFRGRLPAETRGGDPLFIADRTGGNAHQILAPDEEGVLHNHNPFWSSDDQWIYFVRGVEPKDAMDVWRLPSSGGSPEQLTQLKTPMTFLVPLDARTLLYVAPGQDGSGPWLWTLDTVTKRTRRASSGLERYTSVAASRDGRRLVATKANPTVNLWRVPVLSDRLAEDHDVQPFAVSTARALAPRFGGGSLFYLSARGAEDGLWRFQDGRAVEVRKGADGAMVEAPAVARDGSRVAVVLGQEGKRRLTIMAADGTGLRGLADSIDIQGSADWSPDGTWIVVGGSDVQGPALFKIPVDGGAPERLVAGQAANPVWSPDGNLIVYGGALVAGRLAPLLGVRPDGVRVELPPVQARPRSHRFLPNGTGLVYLPREQSRDFWLLDLTTKRTRQLTRLSDRGLLGSFDITPDGKEIVFDRSRENSDIVLIDLPK